jgi:hypothetical protein
VLLVLIKLWQGFIISITVVPRQWDEKVTQSWGSLSDVWWPSPYGVVVDRLLLFCFFFGLCLYLCSLLPCTFARSIDGFPSFDFVFTKVFLSYLLRNTRQSCLLFSWICVHSTHSPPLVVCLTLKNAILMFTQWLFFLSLSLSLS